MKRAADSATPDLFRDYTPAPVVQRFSQERVRAARTSTRIARAVAEAIKQSKLSRAQIAEAMSGDGETVSTAVLNQYSSTANDRHNIPAHRLVALAVVTGDVRLLNAALEATPFVAVDARFEPLIRRELAKEAREKLDREIGAADAQWRAGR